MDILAALDNPDLFGPHFQGESWAAWRVFLAALFALGVDLSALALFCACTGRVAVPDKPFTEAAVIVGRRGGKSRVLALIAVFLACFRDYRPYLAPGEKATIAVLAANKAQARSIFRYVSGLLKAVPSLSLMVANETGEAIELTNDVIIEVAAASFRTTRGYSFAAVLCDETAFWFQDETSANPDVEILRALRPGMASIPGAVLLLASSPYAKRGELYNAFRRHFGKDEARVFVWKADTATMNPRIDPAIIAEAYESDPEAARAEYGAEFRDDLADFVTQEGVDGVTAWGRSELPPSSFEYLAFCDPSGGANDAMTMAIAHLEGDICVLDAVLEIRAPFNPEEAVAQCAALLNRYGVTFVTGDRYAGQWPVQRFQEHGVKFEQSARPKSDIYMDFLALLNAKRVELLDIPRLRAQLVSLERRTARSGKDSVDHAPGGHDDVANAVAGALVALDLDRRPGLIRQRDMLQDDAPLPLPTCGCVYILAVISFDEMGRVAVIYAARMLPGCAAPLIIVDFDAGPLKAGFFSSVATRLRDLSKQCRARNAVCFVPKEIQRPAADGGLFPQILPDDFIIEQRLMSAAAHVGEGHVKISDKVAEKSRVLPFGAALDFKAADAISDPLRRAAVSAIGLSLDLRR